MQERVEEGDSIGYSELNARFHQRIWAAADHPTAIRLLGGLKSQGIRFQYQTALRPGRAERSLGEHEAIFRAIKDHDGGWRGSRDARSPDCGPGDAEVGDRQPAPDR